MARIKIELPQEFLFSTDIAVRITDINYGGHLGNDAFLSIVHEARVQFLRSLGYTEHNVEGAGIIMTDAALLYKAEVLHGEVLCAQVGVADLTRASADLVYRLSSRTTGKEVARVKTGIAFFDYQRKKVVEMPEPFRERVTTTSNHPGE